MKRLAFLCCLFAAAAVDAAPEASRLFVRVRLASGRPAQAEATKTGWRVAAAGALRAELNVPRDAFLCRLAPGPNRDIVQLSIGRVRSARCDALYSPSRDTAWRFEAKRLELVPSPAGWSLSAEGPLNVVVTRNFMKTQRGLKWFKPLNVSAFPRAPAGWCSWYIYHQGVTEREMVKNIDWLAKHLKPFGCEYVQLDDGWQGVGRGYGDNRNWYVVAKKKFPHGMKWLADYIRSKGFKPGIWLIPFATSDEKLFRRRPELFIRRPDGTSIYETRDPKTGKLSFNWTGRYIVDPTSEAGQKWFRDLFRMLCVDWGYDYVKIDGQGGSRGACARWRSRLANPKLTGDEAYRLGLAAIKSVMGPKRFLLNCMGQYQSCGFCEGIRIGGDVGPSWDGMQPAIRSTMAHLFVNHIGFWTDPDVVCVRPRGDHGSRLTFDQAQAWVTLVGVTGQLLMASDCMYALPEERVELLRRIFPVADIRPMELYPLPGRPRVFDLRIAKPEVGEWDVAAVFNWNVRRAATVMLRPGELGLPRARYIAYDVWRKRLLGVVDDALPLTLRPTSCRVVALRAFTGEPQLVGTSRHLTQGADDLLEARWDRAAGVWSGRSRVVAGDPYELRFTLPPGWSADGPARVEGPLAVLTLRSPANAERAWSVHFKKTAAPAGGPAVTEAKLAPARRSVKLTWKGERAIAYRIYRDGRLIAQTGENSFEDAPPRRDAAYRYEISALGWSGESPRALAGEFVRRPSPRGKAPDAWLERLRPVSAQQDWGRLRRGRSVEGNPIRIAGREFKHGLGTHAESHILFRLDNRYQRFEAWVGVDDEKNGMGRVVFQVFVDGKKVFDSGPMKGGQPAKAVRVPLDGADDLELVVTDAGDTINCDHADWADARLIGNR